MKQSYLDYAMSVIVGRALPDVRDGLKPVHRRVLYAMNASSETTGTRPLQEVRPRRRRHHRQVPPPRRDCRLRRTRAHGADVLDARAADRRSGQLRLDRRRLARSDALHRGAHGAHRARADRGSRQGHGRLCRELRRVRERACGLSHAAAESAGQRLERHRRGHGDEHPAAQPLRGARRLHRIRRRAGHHHRRVDGARARARLPHRREDPRPWRGARRVPHGTRAHLRARGGRHRGARRRSAAPRGARAPLSGQQGSPARADRRAGQGQAGRGHLRAARRVRQGRDAGGRRAVDARCSPRSS